MITCGFIHQFLFNDSAMEILKLEDTLEII